MQKQSRDRIMEVRTQLGQKHRDAMNDLRDVHDLEQDELRQTVRKAKRQKVKEEENIPPPSAPTPAPQVVFAAQSQQVRHVPQMPQMPQMQMNMAPMMNPHFGANQQQFMQRSQFGGAWPRPFGY